MWVLKEKDYKLLENILMTKQSSLKNVLATYLGKKYKNVVQTPEYLYAEGTIPIALVAHMDTVFAEPPTEIFYDTRKNVMWSPQGLGADDRAGVFCILKIIEAGYRPHIIFTTDEEMGCIGASKLAEIPCPFKDLRYIIELDRRGFSDCVFYDCDNPEFTDYVENFGFVTEWGSFTDISEICPAWGVAGVNLSVGYRDEHSYTEVLFVGAMLLTISRVKNMLDEKEIPNFKYIPSISHYYNWNKKDLTPLYYQCSGCGKHFNEEDMFAVRMLDKSIAYFCSDCLDKEANHIEICEHCYHPFEYEPREDGFVPYFCPVCEELDYEN